MFNFSGQEVKSCPSASMRSARDYQKADASENLGQNVSLCEHTYTATRKLPEFPSFFHCRDGCFFPPTEETQGPACKPHGSSGRGVGKGHHCRGLMFLRKTQAHSLLPCSAGPLNLCYQGLPADFCSKALPTPPAPLKVVPQHGRPCAGK